MAHPGVSDGFGEGRFRTGSMEPFGNYRACHDQSSIRPGRRLDHLRGNQVPNSFDEGRTEPNADERAAMPIAISWRLVIGDWFSTWPAGVDNQLADAPGLPRPAAQCCFERQLPGSAGHPLDNTGSTPLMPHLGRSFGRPGPRSGIRRLGRGRRPRAHRAGPIVGLPGRSPAKPVPHLRTRPPRLGRAVTQHSR